jgi:hypothetical protein
MHSPAQTSQSLLAGQDRHSVANKRRTSAARARAGAHKPRELHCGAPGPTLTLVPWVLVTRVLPTLRTLKALGALMSYQSFLLKGSTIFFLPPFLPLDRPAWTQDPRRERVTFAPSPPQELETTLKAACWRDSLPHSLVTTPLPGLLHSPNPGGPPFHVQQGCSFSSRPH